jgi:hypothetical protein
MSRSIDQPLANDAAQRAIGALDIINPQWDPLVVAEIELGKILLQMLLADVVIDTIDVALQDREIALDGIGVRVALHVFLCRVVHSLMAGEALTDFLIKPALVGAQIRLRARLRMLMDG